MEMMELFVNPSLERMFLQIDVCRFSLHDFEGGLHVIESSTIGETPINWEIGYFDVT